MKMNKYWIFIIIGIIVLLVLSGKFTFFSVRDLDYIAPLEEEKESFSLFQRLKPAFQAIFPFLFATYEYDAGAGPGTMTLDYAVTALQMSDGCAGNILFAPTVAYPLTVCAYEPIADRYFGCKDYTSGEYGVGDTISTSNFLETEMVASVYLWINWSRIKDPNNDYDHGENAPDYFWECVEFGKDYSTWYYDECIEEGYTPAECLAGIPAYPRPIAIDNRMAFPGIGSDCHGGQEGGSMRAWYKAAGCGGALFNPPGVPQGFSMAGGSSRRIYEGYTRVGSDATCTCIQVLSGARASNGVCDFGSTWFCDTGTCMDGTSGSYPSGLCTFAIGSSQSDAVLDGTADFSLQIQSSGDLTYNYPAPAVCGDGAAEGTEECDGGDFCIACICDSGYQSTIPLSVDCELSPVPPTCGSDTIDAGEVCDGADLGIETCITLGFDKGTLACLSNCLGFDTSTCEYEVINGNGGGGGGGGTSLVKGTAYRFDSEANTCTEVQLYDYEVTEFDYETLEECEANIEEKCLWWGIPCWIIILIIILSIMYYYRKDLKKYFQ